MDTANNPTYIDYLSSGFVPLLCKGYHPKYNSAKDYKTAKEPVSSGWTSPEYQPPPQKEIEAWEKAGGWTGWVIPKGYIAIDNEDPTGTDLLKGIYKRRNIEPSIHRTNKGHHDLFKVPDNLDLAAWSEVYIRWGLKVTYRVGGKNYLILAPTNGRTWDLWKPLEQLPALPDDLLSYDRKNIDHVLNCLAWQVGTGYRRRQFAGYEDIDAAFMVYLIQCGMTAKQIHRAFGLAFFADYQQRRTETMYARTRKKMDAGEPVIGAGSFIQKVRGLGLRETERFAQELQAITGMGRVSVSEVWADPIPFDSYSLLPDFPIDALSGIGREVVEAVSTVNQVDQALTACLYLAALSTCCARKAKVDLISHKEPLNLYICPVYDSGNRKSSTVSEMTKPLYEFQKARQEDMETIIRDAQTAFRIKEKRLERLQKKAADEDDQKQRSQFEKEAAQLARELAENPAPKSPIFLIDDVTPEKLGVLMADNGERMAAITPEGGLFEIMAGRYSKDGTGNIDLFLKAHAGDYWGNHRIGREAKTMQSPALTLCLAVQSEVIEEAGKNHHFRGKGLLARFLYARCKSQVGYRQRQTVSIPPSLTQSYKNHVVSLMEIPFTETNLKLSPEAQRAWDEFYNDIEREMRPGESLQYLGDWGSKLAGAVARIASLLHLAEHGAKGLSLPISVGSVNAACMIGAYFKEHAIAVFGLMQEDPRMKLARQILEYLRRQKPETFKARDVMRHTHIRLSEETDQGIRILLDRGYVREGPIINNLGAGRPGSRTYRVNPKVFEDKYA